jgi:hypothetical protein
MLTLGTELFVRYKAQQIWPCGDERCCVALRRGCPGRRTGCAHWPRTMRSRLRGPRRLSLRSTATAVRPCGSNDRQLGELTSHMTWNQNRAARAASGGASAKRQALRVLDAQLHRRRRREGVSRGRQHRRRLWLLLEQRLGLYHLQGRAGRHERPRRRPLQPLLQDPGAVPSAAALVSGSDIDLGTTT